MKVEQEEYKDLYSPPDVERDPDPGSLDAHPAQQGIPVRLVSPGPSLIQQDECLALSALGEADRLPFPKPPGSDLGCAAAAAVWVWRRRRQTLATLPGPPA